MNGQMIRGASAMNQVGEAKFAEPTTPIPRAIDMLSGSVNQLDSDLHNLAERMNRVLRPSVPQPPAPATHGGLTAVPSASQFTDQINMHSETLERMSAFVRDLLERLEA